MSTTTQFPGHRAEPLTVDHSVDLATGNVASDGDVTVDGDVGDGCEASAGGDLTVAGTVGSARLHAGRHLTVRGGIAGKGVGTCTAGGDLRATHASNVTAEVRGDVTVDTMVFEATVRCGGVLRVENGAIAASTVTAAGGVVCRTLGLPSGAATVVEVGVNEFLRRVAATAVPRIQSLQTRVATLREQAAPFMRRTKMLTPADKERAMEMLFEADEAQAELDRHLAELHAAARSFGEPTEPQFAVAAMVHAGVTLRFRDCEATTTCDIAGCARIVRRRAGTIPYVAIIDDTGSVSPLPTRTFVDRNMAVARRLLEPAHASGN